MKRAFISVTNDLVSDQRIHRAAGVLKEKGYDVTLIGRKLSNSKEISNEYSNKRFKLVFNKGPLFYAEYNLRLLCYLCRKSPDLYYSNDLDTLPANFIASSFHGNKLIYDSHEFFTEVPELVNRKFTQKIWRKIEKCIFPKLKTVITVSQPIADEYEKMYGVKVHVVRNLPTKKENIAKADLDTKDKKVIVYQGALNVDRGIEKVIKAMKYLDDHLLLIMGTGDIENELKALAESENVNDKVYFTGKIPLDKLHSFTQIGDVGFSLEEDTNKNYRYALPNKLFDYVQSGIPVIVSDLPEMKKVVEEYQIGTVTSEQDPEKLATIIKDTISNPDFKQNLPKAAEELCWEKEKKILGSIL